MNFQLHLSQGFLSFTAFALFAALLGAGLTRLLVWAQAGNSSDERMGNAVVGIVLLIISALAVLVAFIMAFVCQYAAYALLVAVFFAAAGIAGLRRS